MAFTEVLVFNFCCCILSHFSRVWLLETLWTVAHQAPPSMGFSRQEYWSGLPFPPPGDPPHPGIEPRSPILQADSLPSEPPRKPFYSYSYVNVYTTEHKEFASWTHQRLLVWSFPLRVLIITSPLWGHQNWMSAGRHLFGDAVASREGEKVTCRATCLLGDLGHQERSWHSCLSSYSVYHPWWAGTCKQVYRMMPFYTHLISKNGEVYKKYIRIPSVVPPKGVLFSSWRLRRTFLVVQWLRIHMPVQWA